MERSLLPLAEATAANCGGKAAMLRRLIEAGTLPVPPGVCLPCQLYREAIGELPGASAAVDAGLAAACEERLARWQPRPRLREELERAAERFGWPLCCRSSASCEDGLEVATAGVFLSRAPVANEAELLDAIRAVWRSLWQPPAWAVLRPAGRWPGGEAMGVVLQPYLRALGSGLLLSRDLGAEGRMRLELAPGPAGALAEGERDPRLLLLPRAGPLAEALPCELDPVELLRLRDAALLLEARLLAAPPDPSLALELEWVKSEAGLFLVQARATRVLAPPRTFPICFHREGDERTLWRWDREHNPEPLSPMHASLVELLDEHRPGPPRHLVLSGYLYQAIREEPEAGAAPGPELGAAWGELREELESALAHAETLAGSPDRLLEVEGALAFFAELQARYAGPLAGARRAAIRRLHGFLLAHGLALEEERERLLALGEAHATLSLAEEVTGLAAELRGDRELLAELQLPGADPLRVSSGPFLARLRELLRRFGCLPHTWDVASATLAEEPARLVPRLLALAGSAAEPGVAHQLVLAEADGLARELASRLEPGAAAELARRIAEARLARALAEEDDLYFARALGVLRRTLSACGEELCARGWLARPGDLFLLDLQELLSILRRGVPGRDLRAEVARRAAAWEGSRELVPPLTIMGDLLSWPLPASGAPLLRGHGVGGVARGRVRRVERLEQLLERPSRGEVLVCATILPALAIALPEAAALVTDHGGLLSHAASLARELGVPAVVGTGRATAELREGERVWVDGTRGIVVRLEP